MQHPFLWTCILAFPVLAAAAGGCASAERAKGRHVVTCVRIHGNRLLPDGAIRDQIVTHSDNWNACDPKPLLDNAELPEDARRIESLYADHGHFDATVVDYGADLRSNGTASVHFRVVEGPGTRVGEIEYEGLDGADVADPEALKRLGEVRDRLARLVPLKVGGPWSQRGCDAGRDRLRKALRDRGFLHAEVSRETRVHRWAHTAAVAFRADVGPLVRVSAVEVAGNRTVPTARILRRVDVRPGDVVAAGALRQVEENISDLGVFYLVTAEPDLGDPPEAPVPDVPPAAHPAEVVVRITVQEMPFHEVRTGLGLGLDNAHSDLHLVGAYQDRNFLGGLRFFEAEARPAVVFLPSLFQPDVAAFATDVWVQFRQPSFLEEYLTLSSRAEYTLDVRQGYRSHGGRGSLGLSRKFLGFLGVGLSFHAEVYSFFHVSASLLSPDFPKPLGLAFRKLTWLTYLRETLAIDLRDNVFDARSGFYGLLALDESTVYLGSQFDYVRLLTDLRGYVTPVSFLSLAFRLVYGQTFPLQGSETPLPARFQGGGLSDHRGYAANREGPFLCRHPDGGITPMGTRGACPGGLSKRVYTGGNLKLLGSVETRWYLPANLGLVAFLDVGEVWAGPGDFDLRDLNVAVGPGLRYYTAFGPIRADLGVLVNGPSPGAVVFHLSIGQAF